MADERSKAIELAFAQIEKQFGKDPSCGWVEGSYRPDRSDFDRSISFDAPSAWAAFRAAA